MHERIITPNYNNTLQRVTPEALISLKNVKGPDNLLRKKKNEAHNKERKFSIRHPKNFKKQNFKDLGLDEIEEKATVSVLNRLEQVLRHDKKSQDQKQIIKQAKRYSNTFTPLEMSLRKTVVSKHGLPIEQPDVDARVNKTLKKLAKGFSDQSGVAQDGHENRRLARKLKTNDGFQRANQLRQDAEIPYHKAHKISLSIDSENPSNQAFNQDLISLIKKRRQTHFRPILALMKEEKILVERQEGLREKTETLRKQLFTNPKEESPKTGFMGKIFSEKGQKIKELAHFITGANIKDIQVFYYGNNQGQKLNPALFRLSETDSSRKNGLTNQDVYQLFYSQSEVPVAQVRTSTGKILFEISYSKGKWNQTHPSIPDNFDGMWTQGNLNFYHRQKNLKVNQVDKIFKRWLYLEEK